MARRRLARSFFRGHYWSAVRNTGRSTPDPREGMAQVIRYRPGGGHVRRLRSLAVGVGILLSTQACGSTAPGASSAASAGGSAVGSAVQSAAPASQASQAAASSSAPSAAAQAVTLTLLEHQKPRCDVLTKVLPGFESAMATAGKNVKVNLTCDVVEDEAFRQKVTLAYQGDTPPDVTSYGGSWVP